MRGIRLLLLQLLLVSSGLCQVAAPHPRYDWKKLSDETVELDPMGQKIGPVSRGQTRAKFSINADSGVFFGVMPIGFLQQAAAAKMTLRTQHFLRSKCGRAGIIKAEFVCDLANGDTFVVRDKRAEGTALLGAFSAMKGGGAMLDRATKPNRLQVTLWEWGCVENCSAR